MMQSTKIIIRPPRVRFFSHQFKSFICEIDDFTAFSHVLRIPGQTGH